MPQLLYRTVTAEDGTALGSVLSGTTPPEVVFLNPMTMDHRYWLDVASLLGPGVSVVFVDQRGSGSSGGSATSAHPEGDLYVVLAAADANASVLVATDMDATSAFAAALEVPERVAQLVVLDPSLPELSDKDSPSKVEAAVEVRRRRMKDTMANLKETMAEMSEVVAPYFQAIFLAREGEDGREQVHTFVEAENPDASEAVQATLADMAWDHLRNHQDMRRIEFPAVASRLGEVEAAVTIGRVVEDELLDLVTDELSRRLPRARVRELAYRGSSPVSLEAPELVAELVSEALTG
ncbi:MAG: alpha/beta fold hydrolase [Acidimicrobiales bacterium]